MTHALEVFRTHKDKQGVPGKFVEVKMLTSRSEWRLMVERSEKGPSDWVICYEEQPNSRGIKTI